MSFECGICMTDVPQRQRVSCTRCVNGVCVRCFRTIATSASKTDVECPYCKMPCPSDRVDSLLTRPQMATRRINIRIKQEHDYIQVTSEHLSDMANLCGLMESLHNLHVQVAKVRMQLFPFTFLHSPDTPMSRADIGMRTRLTNDLEQLQLRVTCVSNHIGAIVNSHHLPETLVADCVSNVFEPCSEDASLSSAYATSPDLQELLAIGLLLCNRHVVRPNSFQYGMVRVVNMRASQTIEKWERELTVQCRRAMLIADWYAEMGSAIQHDRHANRSRVEKTQIALVLDRLSRKASAPKNFKVWLALYRRWRATVGACR